MSETPRWRRYLRFWGPDAEADIEDELSFHLAMKERELEARGTPRERVRREAEGAFGDRQRIEAELREIGRRRARRARRASLLDEVRTDLLQSSRSFRRRPGIPLLVVLILGLGIGAGTAVFSLFDSVVLNPIAVHRPAELVTLTQAEPGEVAGDELSYPMLNVLRQADPAAVRVAGYLSLNVGLRAGEHAEHVGAALVTGNYFHVLGLRAQHGRLLTAADEATPGTTPHAVVSDAFWRRALGGAPDVVGRTIVVNGASLEVVGVASARFRGTTLGFPVDVWIPLTMAQSLGGGGLLSSPNLLQSWQFNMISAVARVGADQPQATVLAELATRYAAAAAEIPEQPFALGQGKVRTLAAQPFNEAAVARNRADLLRFLMVLAAVVATCLAIGCVNVANLMLIRSTERTAELSVRSALGADRRRLLRQLLLESALLGVVAGVFGVGVALLAMRLLSAFALPGGIALADVALALDLRVLGFTALASLCCTIAFGLAPALSGAATDVMDALRSSVHGRRRSRLGGGHALVSVQVALSLVLLVSGFLFLRSLQQALQVDLGYRTQGVASLAVGLEQHGYGHDTAPVFIETVLRELAARPAVRSGAAATRVPIDPGVPRLPVKPQGAAAAGEGMATISVTSGYFELFGIPVLRGRGIEVSDRQDTRPVAVLTESAARRLWPDEDPLGRELVIMFGDPFTVVGIVADAHFTRLTDPEAHVFLALPQTLRMFAMGRLHFIARSSSGEAAITALRSSVAAADRRLPTFREQDVTAQLDAVLMPQRFGSMLLGLFGTIALIISAVGIYAVAAFDVARRRRELGIRAALGANAMALARTVLVRSGSAIGVGLIAGLAAAAFATRSLDALLFGVRPGEPVSYAAAAFALGATALFAAWLPARRAARIDPLTVIRE